LESLNAFFADYGFVYRSAKFDAKFVKMTKICKLNLQNYVSNLYRIINYNGTAYTIHLIFYLFIYLVYSIYYTLLETHIESTKIVHRSNKHKLKVQMRLYSESLSLHPQ